MAAKGNTTGRSSKKKELVKSWGLSIPPSLRERVVKFARKRGLTFSKAMCQFAEHGMTCKAHLRKAGAGSGA